jgi:hypothetical protein
MGVRAIGNRQGFTYNYDDIGMPQFYSPFAESLGGDLNTIYSLNNNMALNNITWDLILQLIRNNFNASFGGLGDYVVDNWLPSDIPLQTNTVATLNLTTEEFDEIDPQNIQDIGTIKNQITNTYELGYKGILHDDKLFLTVDGYMNDIKDFVSPLIDITPNVFINWNEIAAYLTPVITESYNDTSGTNSLLAGLLTLSLDNDPQYNGNGNGTGVDELINIVVGAATGIPLGTISPQQYPGITKYVSYVNVGDVTIFGVDLGATYLVNDKTSLSLSYSWVNTDSIPVEGAQLGYIALNAPKNKFAVRANYNIEKIDLNVGLTFRWQQSFPANSGAYVGRVDDIHDLDLTLNYRPDYIKDTQFALLITNLYNHEQQYFIGAPVIGSSYFFKITKSF